jgi:hypothetical protein
MRKNVLGWLDTTGATASWLCAVHCIVLPFTISLLPLAGLSFLLDETTERVFIGISTLVAALSLLPAYFRQHGKIRTLVLFASGISLVVASHLAFEDNLVVQIPFLVIGAILITIAHLINRRLCRACIAC